MSVTFELGDSWCDDREPCAFCGEPFDGAEDDEGHFLHDGCRDDYRVSRAERAHEDWLGEYFGGDRPCTQEEYYQAAAAERRDERKWWG